MHTSADPTNSAGPGQRQLRCTIIGAGISGILMAYKLKTHLSEYIDFELFEKSPELGGTWYENRYPGCACDVPSHCYQYSFATNPNWTKLYASSREINNYLKGVARHFDLERYIHYNTKVTSATWSSEQGTWAVQLENGRTVISELLVNASGILNNLQMPDIDGLSSFSGPLLHTAAWDASVDLRGKRVGIVGSGASGIQLLPKLQPLASKVQVYIRTPSWICPPVGMPKDTPPSYQYSPEDMERFRVDGKGYLDTRKEMESQFNSMFRAFFKASPEQRDVRNRFEERMKSLIPDKTMQEHLIPKFEAGCRRISPGEGFLTALQKPNVTPVFDRIEKVTPKGVIANGVLHEADVLVAATGFNTSFRPRFPIIGLDGVNMQNLWEENPVSYMGTGVSGFPNYLLFLGPNTPISNGSLMGPLEATSDYFIRLLRKMVRQGAKSFNIRPDSQADFDTHVQSAMRDMVWTGTCRSWFKRGVDGKVTALWPGSSLHYMQVLAENRWEDYEWEYKRERYAYWGSGFSWIEDPAGDPLGIDERESWNTMSTIPQKDSDLSYYLWNSTPLPAEAIGFFEPDPEEIAAPTNVVARDDVDKEGNEMRLDKPEVMVKFIEEPAVVTVPV